MPVTLGSLPRASVVAASAWVWGGAVVVVSEEEDCCWWGWMIFLIASIFGMVFGSFSLVLGWYEEVVRCVVSVL